MLKKTNEGWLILLDSLQAEKVPLQATASINRFQWLLYKLFTHVYLQTHEKI